MSDHFRYAPLRQLSSKLKVLPLFLERVGQIGPICHMYICTRSNAEIRQRGVTQHKANLSKEHKVLHHRHTETLPQRRQ